MKTLFLLFKFLKLGKVMTTGGTMLLSVFVYAWVFGLPYAAGFVALIFVHEMGHYFAARQRGLNVGVPVFIPFVGAWISLKEMPRNVDTEAYIGFAGPFVGSVAALMLYFIARQTDSQLLLALSYAGFFINLFNLIPLSPFDGGRIVAIISPKLWLVGIPVLVLLFIYRPSPILILVSILALPQVWRAIRGKTEASELHPDYYQVSLEQRLTYGFYYLALLIFLAIMSNDVHAMLSVKMV